MNWHYQAMRHTDENGNTWYAIHEFYPIPDEPGWTENEIRPDGESIQDLRTQLLLMLLDIDRHGIKDYATGLPLDCY